MKIKELFEAVIKADFGKKRGVEQDTGIEVPKGYDRFEVDHEEGKNVGKVIGIKGDKRVVVSSGHIDLVRELVKAYNKGGKTDSGLKPITLMQAFGSKEMNLLNDAGIKFTEKPTYWEDFEGEGYAAKRNIHQVALKKAEKVLGKIPVLTGKEVFGYSQKPKGPLVSTKVQPKDMPPVAIIMFDDGTKYLVDTTQANSYIRMWQKID